MTIFLLVTLTGYLLLKVVQDIDNGAALEESRTTNAHLRSKVAKNIGFALTVLCYGVVFFLVDKHFFHLAPTTCYRVGLLSHFIVLSIVLTLSAEILVTTVYLIRLRRMREFLV
jgi:small-conductance mechanosensitive channel